jgi:hypothetical protein
MVRPTTLPFNANARSPRQESKGFRLCETREIAEESCSCSRRTSGSALCQTRAQSCISSRKNGFMCRWSTGSPRSHLPSSLASSGRPG